MNQPDLFPVAHSVVDASVHAPIPHGWTGEIFKSLGKNYKRAIDFEGFVWYWCGEWILNVPWFDSNDNPVPENIHGRRIGRMTKNKTLIIGNRRIHPTRWNH